MEPWLWIGRGYSRDLESGHEMLSQKTKVGGHSECQSCVGDSYFGDSQCSGLRSYKLHSVYVSRAI